MNGHLELIFRIVLPGLEFAGIKYWVFGGVANAAFGGSFFRTNGDVDIFVLDEDFEHARVIVETMAKGNRWTTRNDASIKDRPKLELKIDTAGKDIFSIIPVYKIDDKIELRLYNKRL